MKKIVKKLNIIAMVICFAFSVGTVASAQQKRPAPMPVAEAAAQLVRLLNETNDACSRISLRRKFYC